MVLTVLMVFAGGCLAAVRLASPSRRKVPKARRERLRDLGWAAALLAIVLTEFVLFAGDPRWPVIFAVTATGLLVILAPPLARMLVPFILVGLGLWGLVSARSIGPPAGAYVIYESAHTYQFAQSCVFLAAGLCRIWRMTDRRSRLVGTVFGRPPRWGVLLLPVLAIVVTLIGPSWWFGPSLGNIAATAAALLIALSLVILKPEVAADLAVAGLIALGGYGTGFALSRPRVLMLVYYRPNGFATSAGSGQLAVLAGVQGVLLLAFGLWLVPRTIGPHVRALLRAGPDAELAHRVQRLTKSRTAAVDSAAAELRRLERDLHDGAQARLVALGMNLRAVERLIQTSPQAAMVMVAEARETSSRALNDLRELVRGIYPPVLADRGLADAVRALALDTPLRTEVDIDLAGRLDAPVESACYFAVAEAFANAVKHSGARLVQIRIRHCAADRRAAGDPGGMLRIEVTDDGCGGADPAKGSGLAGVEQRLSTFDGVLAVSSPPGGPTMIIIEVPCALSSPRIYSC